MTTLGTTLGTTFAQQDSGLAIPETPDLSRMRRETGARLRAAMTERGVDALVLLGNNAVVYATGTSWPLGDAGLSYVERPVAVVLADDEWPHLFLPFREGAAQESELPADHLHGPRSTSNSTRGSPISRGCWPSWYRVVPRSRPTN